MIAHPGPVGPGVWRLPLPSRTPPPFDHTNTYLVGNNTETVLVDAGSDDPAVLDALETILSTLNLARPQALLLTHTHSDHRTGAAALRERYGLEVYAHPLELPRLEIPARALEDGATLTVGTQTVNVHHTPGHSPGHLSFALPSARTLLVGDLLTAEGSSFVGLPDGDVAAYLASLERLESLTATLGTSSHTVTLGPGHGPLVRNPGARLHEVRAHRLAREAEVAAALGGGPLTLAELKKHIYPDLPEALTGLAEGSLRAHLVKLTGEGRVVEVGTDTETRWRVPR